MTVWYGGLVNRNGGDSMDTWVCLLHHVVFQYIYATNLTGGTLGSASCSQGTRSLIMPPTLHHNIPYHTSSTIPYHTIPYHHTLIIHFICHLPHHHTLMSRCVVSYSCAISYVAHFYNVTLQTLFNHGKCINSLTAHRWVCSFS